MSPSLRRLCAILLLLTAAVCSHQASTRGWGVAQGRDHTHYRLAPNGLALRADSAGTSLASCHWFPLRGTDPLCQAARGSESRFERLTYAYPALQGGAWLNFLAAVVVLLAGAPAATFTRSVVALAAILVVVGIVLVISSVPAAVQALAGLPFAFGGLGLLLAAVAPVFAAAAGSVMPAADRHAT